MLAQRAAEAVVKVSTLLQPVVSELWSEVVPRKPVADMDLRQDSTKYQKLLVERPTVAFTKEHEVLADQQTKKTHTQK